MENFCSNSRHEFEIHIHLFEIHKELKCGLILRAESNLIMRKVLYLVATLVIAVLALTFTGGLVVSAWSATASYTCLGTSQITSCTGQNNPSFPVSTMVYDTAVIQDPNGIVGSCSSQNTSGCVQGYIIFLVYNGLSCQGTPIANSGKLHLAGNSYPGVVIYGHTATTAGSFSVKAAYYGNYDDNTLYGLPCEPLTITTVTTGVPEFPLGSLGSVLLLAALIPMMLYMRSRVGRSWLSSPMHVQDCEMRQTVLSESSSRLV